MSASEGKPRPLEMWVVYNRPLDYPNSYVARLWWIEGGKSEPTAKDEIIVSHSLENVRNVLRGMRLSSMGRHQRDEPHIVEVWL